MSVPCMFIVEVEQDGAKEVYIMKRLTAIFTALVFITLALAFPIHATNVVVWNSSVEDTLAEIDALHALRNEMILNNEMDDEAFAKIDVRLAEIGVREISQADLMNKLSSCVSTQVTAPPIAGIIWSQYTNVINYFGKMYDIQVVTGDIDRSNVYASPLRSTPSVVCAKQDFQAGSVLGCAVNIGASVVGELSSDTLPAEEGEQPVYMVTLPQTMDEMMKLLA